MVRLESPDAFDAVKLIKAKPVDWTKVVASWGAVGMGLKDMQVEMQSSQLQCKVGTLFVGDLVAFAFEGSYGVGFIQGFVKLVDGNILCILLKLSKEAQPGACFSKSPVRIQTILVSPVSFIGAFPHFCQGDKVYLLASADLFVM